ncbi:hypothetical protein THAOC_17595, partial [Thalassiosira oceanica]
SRGPCPEIRRNDRPEAPAPSTPGFERSPARPRSAAGVARVDAPVPGPSPRPAVEIRGRARGSGTEGSPSRRAGGRPPRTRLTSREREDGVGPRPERPRAATVATSIVLSSFRDGRRLACVVVVVVVAPGRGGVERPAGADTEPTRRRRGALRSRIPSAPRSAGESVFPAPSSPRRVLRRHSLCAETPLRRATPRPAPASAAQHRTAQGKGGAPAQALRGGEGGRREEDPRRVRRLREAKAARRTRPATRPSSHASSNLASRRAPTLPPTTNCAATNPMATYPWIYASSERIYPCGRAPN